MTRETGRWRARSPQSRFAGSARSARRWRGGWKKACRKRGGALEWTLIVAAAQILFLDTPDHAAVDLAVKATRADPASAPFAALANAVLRAIARDRDAILADSDPLDDDTPAWLAQRWRSTYGESVARAIAAAHRSEPTLDLSVKGDASGWAERLGGIVLPTGSVRLDTPCSRRGTRRLWRRRMVGAGRRGGACRPGSFGRHPGMRVVDLCAAPGGKAAELAAAGADLTTVDRSAERLKLLAANFERLRLRSEIVVADALAFDAAPFDAVLLDAPCSATGTIRRHPDVAWIKRQGDLAPARQAAGRTARTRRSRWRGRAAPSFIACARSSPRRAKRRSPPFCAATRTCAV